MFSRERIEQAKRALGLCPDQDMQAINHLRQREALRQRVRSYGYQEVIHPELLDQLP